MALKKITQFPMGDDGPITASVYHNGVLYLGGFFRNYGGVPRNGLVAIDAVTYQVLPWNPDINISFSSIESMTATNGKIIVGGLGITSVNGGAVSTDNLIVVDAVTGVYDSSFGTHTIAAAVNGVATDGNIVYFVGLFTSVDATTRNRGAAIDMAAGTLTPWDPDFNAQARSIQYSSNEVFTGGIFSSVKDTTVPVSRAAGASFSATGLADTAVALAWDPSTSGPIDTIEVSGSSVFIGGTFTSANTSTTPTAVTFITKVDRTTGVIDGAFSLNSAAPVTSLKVFQGQLHVGTVGGALGYVSVPEDRSHIGFAIFSLNGVLDTSFRQDVTGPVNSIEHFGDTFSSVPNSLFIGGLYGLALSNIFEIRFAAYTNEGVLKSIPTIEVTGGLTVNAMRVDEPNGIAYIGGNFTTLTGPNGTFFRLGMGAFNISTGDILPWAPSHNSGVEGVSDIQIDPATGIIYVVGDFSQVGGTGQPTTTARSRAAAFDAAGNLLAFDPNLGGGLTITRGLAIDASHIYIGGAYTTVNGGTPQNHLARFNKSTGVVDGTWDPSITGGLSSPRVDVVKYDVVNSKLYLGGNFQLVGAVAKNGLSRIDIATALDDGWTPDLDNGANNVADILLNLPDIRVVGNFSLVDGGTSRLQFAQWDDAGVLDPISFTVGSAPVGPLFSHPDRWFSAFTGVVGSTGFSREGFASFDFNNVLIGTDPALNDSVLAFDETTNCLFVGGQFTRALNQFNSQGVQFYQEILAGSGIPAAPKLDYLLRKDNNTFLRWQAVFRDQEHERIDVEGYKIYRSTNTNLEEFQLIATITTPDVKGVVDTFFSENIEGFFAYAVSAFNPAGESPLTVGEAVNSTVDQDLFE